MFDSYACLVNSVSHIRDICGTDITTVLILSCITHDGLCVAYYDMHSAFDDIIASPSKKQ